MSNIKKGAGILLHISSLPGRYGIGTMGKEAYRFVDFLKSRNLRYWQVLPLVQTGYGDSPYQSVYSGSGNPYFIDLEILCEKGLLKKSELSPCEYGGERVDYSFLSREKLALLRRAFSRFDCGDPEFLKFERGGEFRGYALFMALKEANGGASFAEWEDKFKYAHARSLAKFQRENEREYLFWLFVQFEFRRQWLALKKYANRNGVSVIGDLPLYVAYDSADVWLNPRLFKLNPDRSMQKVAGVPPDYFSQTGQLWGNPVYRWRAHEREGFQWWIERFRQAFSLYDVVRLDHFRGFDRYYEIAATAETAERGIWERGPRTKLFRAAESALGSLRFIAEDLGALDEGVYRLLDETGFPRMKVIEFAFDGNPDNPHLPEHISADCVCYTGTHDNDTLLGYVESLHKEEFEVFYQSLSAALNGEFPLNDRKSMAEAMLYLALKSRAGLKIVPIQDALLLNGSARMNTPATQENNWQFRLAEFPKPKDFCSTFLTYCGGCDTIC